MAANVAVAQDPCRQPQARQGQKHRRIDGIVATIMAIGRAMVAQEEQHVEYSRFFV
jgi:phage terminase large subunit-like protein